MAVIQKPDTSIIWAENGNTLEPSTEKQEIGWVVEKPTNEMMNWVHQQSGIRAKYLFQRGASVEWDADETYPKDARIDYGGKLYVANIANNNKQPDTNPAVWGVAFASFSLEDDVYQIKNQVNYAEKLVYKEAPEFTSVAVGVGYLANTGLSANEGYSFNEFSTDGLFHNGTSPIIMKNGVEVARFEPVTDRNESNKKVVTMDILQQYLQQYKVGDLYITTNTGNPSTILGYGNWVRYAEGRAIVGFNSDTSSASPDWTKTVESTYGSYTHKLTVDELASHSHGQKFFNGYGDQPAAAKSGDATTNASHTVGSATIASGTKLLTTYETGGDQPHNNVQPSIVVFIWRRTG